MKDKPSEKIIVWVIAIFAVAFIVFNHFSIKHALGVRFLSSYRAGSVAIKNNTQIKRVFSGCDIETAPTFGNLTNFLSRQGSSYIVTMTVKAGKSISKPKPKKLYFDNAERKNINCRKYKSGNAQLSLYEAPVSEKKRFSYTLSWKYENKTRDIFGVYDPLE